MKRHFICIVGFETDKLDKEGNPKLKNSKFLVEDVDIFSALTSIHEYLKTDSRGYDVRSISEAKFEDIIGQSVEQHIIQKIV